MEKVAIPTDHLTPSHKSTLAAQVEVGEVKNPPVDVSPSPPTPPAQDFCPDFGWKV